MTRVLALAGQSKIGCITQRRFAKAGTKTHSQRGAALDRNGLSVSTETACRFEPKSPVGNSEICKIGAGQIIEQHIEADVEQVAPAPDQMIEQGLLVFEQPVVTAIQLVDFGQPEVFAEQIGHG